MPADGATSSRYTYGQLPTDDDDFTARTNDSRTCDGTVEDRGDGHELQLHPVCHDGHRLYTTRYGSCGRRHVICWLGFVSGSILQAQRTALPIAIVRMQSTFGWDKALQGQLLSAFFLGYFTLQLPGGVLATRCWSPRMLTGCSVAMASLVTLFIPTAALAAPFWLYLCRLAQGAAQGPWSSALAALWSQWSPPEERSQMDSFPQVGLFVGALVFGSLTGVQCDHPDWPLIGGWQGVFRLHGLLGLVWVLLWFGIIRPMDDPASDRQCSDAERDYIQSSLAAEVKNCGEEENNAAARIEHVCPADDGLLKGTTGVIMPRPLSTVRLALEILSSGPVWAIVIVQSFSSFTAFILDDGLPSYLRDVAGLSLTQAGILASLPALIKTILTLTAAWVADRVRHPSRGRRWATTGRVRKLFTGAAIGPQALLLGIIAMSTELTSGNYQTLVLSLLVVTDGLGGLRYGGGASVNHLDIAPCHAGIIQGFKNTVAQLAGYMAPILLSWLTPYPGGLSREEYEQHNAGQAPPEEWVRAMRLEWRTVFMVAAMVDSVGLVVYFALGSGRRQWWDLPVVNSNAAARAS